MDDTRVRLLKVVPTLMCGGTENQFMALGRSLDPGRFALEYACLRRVGGFVAEIDQRRIPLREYGIDTFFSVNAITQQARLARDISRSGTQIVHAYSFYGNVFAVPPARFAAAPVVIASIRDRGAYLTAGQQAVQRHVCRLADCVARQRRRSQPLAGRPGLQPGEDRRHSQRRRSPAVATIRLTPNASAESSECRRALRLVAVASRLNRLKGIDHFLEAAAIVGRRVPDVRFLVIGEPNPSDRAYLDVLMRLAERLGIRDRVVFTGLRTDVPDSAGVRRRVGHAVAE